MLIVIHTPVFEILSRLSQHLEPVTVQAPRSQPPAKTLDAMLYGAKLSYRQINDSLFNQPFRVDKKTFFFVVCLPHGFSKMHAFWF